MAFSIARSALFRTSREILDRRIIGSFGLLNRLMEAKTKMFFVPRASYSLITTDVQQQVLLVTTGQYFKKLMSTRAYDLESDSDSESDNETHHVNQKEIKQKKTQRGDSEFWRRKMRTLHKILDVNRDGVISFDDFNLLTRRFTDIGNISPEMSAEFHEVMKATWEEQWGEMSPYNLVTAEQFLTDLHHKLNDKELVKKIGRFLPYVFKAVDTDHSGHLDLDQYKLFFRCLGLTDDDAAISFAVIDKNGDGQLSLKEFVHLGRQYFLTENEHKISKMFWGPLVNH